MIAALLVPGELILLSFAVSATTVAAAASHSVGEGLTSLWSAEAIIALLTLTAMEIVLGVDNIVFIAILVGKLPQERQKKARQLGLSLAMGIRILLLLTISWIMGLTADLFSVPKFWTGADSDRLGISGRDLILLVGGLFLIGKATFEIHDKLEAAHESHPMTSPGVGANVPGKATASFNSILLQILLLDVVFSLDSVITAVGMVQTNPAARWVGMSVMIAAVVIAVGVMLVVSGRISAFVERHPTIKMLALSFLVLIGVMLVAESLDAHIPKGYIYFAMAFALGVEMLNIRLRKPRKSAEVSKA